MAKRWKVNKFTQVIIDGKVYTDGDTFDATDKVVEEAGATPYVAEVRQQAAKKAANKAIAAPEPRPVKSTAKKA